MVIEKPIQFTIVRAVPFNSRAALWATIVEKSGESAMTTIPHKNRKPTKIASEDTIKKKGETRQQSAESNRAEKATLLVPKACARYPPNTQANPPMAIIKKESSGILKAV